MQYNLSIYIYLLFWLHLSQPDAFSVIDLESLEGESWSTAHVPGDIPSWSAEFPKFLFVKSNSGEPH